MSDQSCRFEAGSTQLGLQVPTSLSSHLRDCMGQNRGKAATHLQHDSESSIGHRDKLKARTHQKKGTRHGDAKGPGDNWHFDSGCDQSPLCSCWVHHSLSKTLGTRCLLENNSSHFKKVIYYLYIPYTI